MLDKISPIRYATVIMPRMAEVQNQDKLILNGNRINEKTIKVESQEKANQIVANSKIDRVTITKRS